MENLQTISEIKLKLRLGEKLNSNESHILLTELKGDKYINLLLKQKEYLLTLMVKLNKARKESVSSLNGGNGDFGLNLFTTEMQELVSNQIEELDNQIADIAEIDSIYWCVS